LEAASINTGKAYPYYQVRFVSFFLQLDEALLRHIAIVETISSHVAYKIINDIQTFLLNVV
jgi:hypothetical protein